jgi:hypothetical protein
VPETPKRGFIPSTLDGHFHALGRLAALWASLEHEINSAVWNLANVESRHGACLTSQLYNPTARMKAFVALIRERGGTETLAGAVNKVSAKIASLGERRNRLIHDPWVGDPAGSDAGYQLEITAVRKLHYQWRPETVETINETSLEILDVRTEFMKVYKQALDELPSFPQTQFLQSFDIPGMTLNKDSCA